ncbi:hypothetical protein D920_01479 [Enterococcus faecalis 13-SD-W-01]|nr:hypothetical protein D920_01479 [Enterococcus faecalis 13-SD-W-01]
MKKVGFITLLGSLFLLSACGTSSSTNMSSSSIAASSTTSEKDSSITNKTSSSSVAEESSSTQSSQVQESTLSTETSQAGAETTASSTPIASSNIPEVSTQEEALQLLINNTPELQNEDIVMKFYRMVGSDYLFAAYSKSILEQGGSGTVGFYRVSPQGAIILTDAYGNPI